ncbi:H/ACA ribonucleoprotein complex non-core subunit NAF1 isoform X1 [Tiliqua scincoides]|uniref:H/ACA ribonucleoprotein complex non-core subunit NAF1 isoform X1 n=1 Tax=Tiliqua scincoides TaxID=71010 RepID=UPI0034634BDD
MEEVPVTERLQTLSVACRSGDGESPSAAPEPGLRGGESPRRVEGPAAEAEPPLEGGATGAAPGRGDGRQQPEAPVEGEYEPSPVPCPEGGTEPPASLGCAPRPLPLSGGAASGGPAVRGAPEGTEGRVPQAGLPGREDSTMEGGGSSSEADSDADTDSSSSVSSSSSGLPMLSDEDADQQHKNESDHVKEKDELSGQKPVEDVKIILPEFVKLVSFGKVSSVIEHLVIIESLKGLQPVNEDTVLFREDRHSIGKVFEVFGPVSHPFYVLQFNSPEHIETKGIKVHDIVYFAPSVENFTQYIFPEKLKQYKGSDASWENDEEPPPEALDFSDDEKESAAKHQKKKSQNLRKKLRAQQGESNESGTYHPRRQYPSDGSRGCRRGERNASFSRGCHRGEHNPSFSRGCHRGEHNQSFSGGCHRGEYNPRNRFPHSSSHCFLGQPVMPPQYCISDSTEPQKFSACYPHQSQGGLGSYQYSFPPPSFETVSYEANHFPPPPATWGWPSLYTQNVYDPLLSLLSLPPPPPPPSPPPSPAPL